MGVENQFGSAVAVDWDTTLAALSVARRRYLLAALADSGGESTVDEMARQVLAHETGAPVETVDEDQLDAVVTVFTHMHVPSLVENGFVEWAADRQQLTLTETALAHPVLLPLARWSRYPTPMPFSADSASQTPSGEMSGSD